jgi:hypothetical protein
MSLVFTARYTRIQPKLNLQEASGIQVVDRSKSTNEFRRPSGVSTNEFHLDGGDDDDEVDAVVLTPTTDTKDATTRDVSVPKVTVKNAKKDIRAKTNTGRSPRSDSVKSFQVDAFEALRMYDSGATLPDTDNARKEKKDAKPKDRKKKEKKEKKQEEEKEERPRRKKKREKQEEEKEERPQRNKKAASNNRANTREKGLPQVAWIMSFGGSVSEMHQVEEWAAWLFLSAIEYTFPFPVSNFCCISITDTHESCSIDRVPPIPLLTRN